MKKDEIKEEIESIKNQIDEILIMQKKILDKMVMFSVGSKLLPIDPNRDLEHNLQIMMEEIQIIKRNVIGNNKTSIDYNSIKHLQGITMTNSEKCEHNLKTLNDMMLQLKGVIAMVKPSARRNEWYQPDKEINATAVDIKNIEIEHQ